MLNVCMYGEEACAIVNDSRCVCVCVWHVVQLELYCVISDDLKYTRATPTFHHWQTGGCSYGLTFQIPPEADTFAKAVGRSVEAIRHECSSEGRIKYLTVIN